MSNPNPKEKWASKIGLILVVASCAIGLGNFLRFPGLAAKHGGGAFMVPYVISFLFLGIPVCLAEWIMGRMGGKNGHSSPKVFSAFLPKGVLLNTVSSIAIIIPTLIYVYYVFIEAWCLAYAIDFLTGAIQIGSGTTNTSKIVENAGIHFQNLTGSKETGAAMGSKILLYTCICYFLNYFILYRGISKGLESLAKFAFPVLLFCAVIVLGRVTTLPGIEKGYAFMWNPDWSKLFEGEVWIAAAGQIFFSLSVGFGIVLVFTSYLTEKDDVALSGLSAASLNELVEVGFGGMITIPLGFLFLGLSVANYGTFGMGFIALPSVFTLMKFGQFFGFVWFLVLFLAAITSSVTMLQPGINFLEEDFLLKRKTSTPILFTFTFILTMLILYFNRDFTALDLTDFWIGTIFIYILATVQVWIYGWKIGTNVARVESEKGALWKIPKSFDFIIKYISPSLLLIMFTLFIKQSFWEYFQKMNPVLMASKALESGADVAVATEKAYISLGVFVSLILIFILIYSLVAISFKRTGGKND
ncbi:MAG: sodium-dependent transporter [Leptospiraceae bacterium]|nr:sodium-dependent transporter [Leptospiraceae bacterium]